MAENSKQLECSPATPMRRGFDVQARIETLRWYLDPANPNYEPERQHVNIRAAIKLYEEGQIDGIQSITIINGKIAPFEDAFKSKSGSWIEVLYS